MIGTIARKELTDTLRDGRFRWAGGILFILILVSLAAAWRDYQNYANSRDLAQAAQREQWLNKEMSNPHVAAHSGFTLFRPLLPLAAIDGGLSNYLGTSVFLEPHRRNFFQRSAVENASFGESRLGPLSVALVLQQLLPLLIILLTFTTFAGEREQGTLRQTLSLGVDPRELALGKIIGVTAPLALLLIPTALVGILVLIVGNSSASLSDNLSRGSAMAAAYFVYFIIFLGLGLFVSAKSRTSQKALIVLLGFWFVTCLLAPRLAVAVGQRLYPTPTAEEFADELEKETEPVSFAEQRAQVEKRLLQQYNMVKAVDLPVSTWGLTLYEREEASTELYNRQFKRLFDQYERQTRFYQAVSVLAPSIAVQTVSMGLAATDVVHFRRFNEAAESYRYGMVQTMNKLAIQSRLYNASLAAPPDRPPFINGEREAYEQVPPFEYAPPSWKWVIRQTAVSVFSLLLWLALVPMMLSRALRRLKVE